VRLSDVAEALEAEILLGENELGREVRTGGAADMVSDLRFFGSPGMVLLTGLTKASMVRAAEFVDACAVVYVRGKRPDEDALELAQELGVPLLATAHSLYDSCGRLYVKGLPGVIPRRQESGQQA